MGLKITTLIENLAYGDGLLAEHGLSLLIETPKGLVLFDTGQSGNFLKNMRTLGIDAERISAVALSHGHYDHTGGLESFCAVNKTAKIYCKRRLFVPKFKNAGTDSQKSIGTPFNAQLYGHRIEWVDRETEILPGLFALPEIPIANSWDTHFASMSTREDSGFSPDTFDDEQFLVFEEANSIDVFSGCSHRGITNIVAKAVERFRKPLRLILGGFHTNSADESVVGPMLAALSDRDFGTVGVCHCTGVEKYPEFRAKFGSAAFYNYTGKVVSL